MGSLKFDFTGRHALITGGARGIGEKTAQKFLESGARVTLWDKDPPSKKEEEKHITFQQVDVSKPEDCEREAKALKAPIDFLINNAGILRDRSFPKMTREDYQTVIDTNLNSVFHVTKSLLPFFNSHSFKRIVNFSSVTALYGNFGQTNYAAAKAGVIGLTKVWARELGRKGWTVNAIAPGFIDTRLLKNLPEEVRLSLPKKIPVGRLGQTEDTANVCLFLCSEEAGYINGTVLSVDGGVTL